MAGLLQGRSAVITGVGPGIGRATALALSEQGADVALGARTESALKELANEIETTGRRAVFSPTNIADAEQCATLAKTAADAFGKIDVVVQNAFMHGPFAGAHDTDPEDWRKVFKVNVQGTLQMIQACLPYMTSGGSIIVTNSMALRTSTPTEGPYAASKAAMHSMVRTLAQELGPRDIRVNSVLPGWVNGPSLDVYFELQAAERGNTPKQVHDELAGEIPLRRLVTPDDIAGAIVFLASGLANGITGIAVDVNGGHYLP
jgi:NAD(P)-dependent dehydrogenase (short-subunit alcohol dehydrogenase family)